MAKYTNYSPYKDTPQSSWSLDLWKSIQIPPMEGDVEFEIGTEYQHRPDLLANDVYGTSELWWVFSVRNPDLVKDPIFDLKAGITIYLTHKDKLMSLLNS